MAVGITRMTTAQLPRWMKMFTRKRARPGQAEGDVAGALLAQDVDGLLVVADEVGGDAAGIIRGEHAQSRTLDHHQLPIDFHLGWTPRRENQVAHLVTGAQHGRQQGVCGRRARVR